MHEMPPKTFFKSFLIVYNVVVELIATLKKNQSKILRSHFWIPYILLRGGFKKIHWCQRFNQTILNFAQVFL